MMMTPPGYSSRVCLTCRAGKRKCDKALPTCARCARLEVKCNYEVLADNLPSNPSPPPLPAIVHPKAWTSWLGNAYASFHNDPSPYLEHVETYFDTVDRWLPILHKEAFMEGFRERPFTPDFLLLMSMCLIVQRPDKQSPEGSMFNDQYHAVKHYFCHEIADNVNTPSIRLIQAGILLATYEYGHGMINAAYNTIYSCVSTSITLGLHRQEPPRDIEMDPAWRQQTEGLRTWWAVVISERIFCLSSPTSGRMPITRVPNESTYLSDLNLCEGDSGEQDATIKETPPQANFYRQFQASILIRHVLELINDPPQAPEEIHSPVRVLDLQLRRAIEINLGAETSRLNSVIEALAMNRSSLVILHQWHRESSRISPSFETTNQSQMVIESMTTIMVDTVHDFLPRIYAGWPKSHHPQGTQSVYLAALELLSKQESPRSRANLISLKEMLRLQSRRWGVAASHLEDLSKFLSP
ncbi:hypothetical protein BO94DRAFT_13350 [Aspergillus sclerotioniger CBS 115572]|uniref:Zn(2)-C6 fungal-type domain-containing protein n=1 Tax=Aspergillus sclerotioniger CBS 115572 TaxID=1450535 RepID=A0A317XD88_9EURO|nr:hypothetical protein BO94DRAFT_13350 [Aspergillus sclerotioniger CBS 115572]PWY96493.1 hypothetical protein BO94DRAFT_13350 [Aspergillus sclerotioniger CBS 115572]